MVTASEARDPNAYSECSNRLLGSSRGRGTPKGLVHHHTSAIHLQVSRLPSKPVVFGSAQDATIASRGVGLDDAPPDQQVTQRKEYSVDLGAFSISLAVKDILASQAFYERFGFEVFAGDVTQNWLILRNRDHSIGLFQGMFEKNTLTFNPGWSSDAREVEKFTDVRELQRRLKAQGVELLSEADESTTGPASFIAVDPDGNPILVDQHV